MDGYVPRAITQRYPWSGFSGHSYPRRVLVGEEGQMTTTCIDGGMSSDRLFFLMVEELASGEIESRVYCLDLSEASNSYLAECVAVIDTWITCL